MWSSRSSAGVARGLTTSSGWRAAASVSTTRERPARSTSSPSGLSGSATYARRRDSGKTRERTYYTLTEKGLTALREWLGRPSAFPRIQSEAAARVVSSDLAEDERVVAESLRALRKEIGELSAGIDEDERRACSLPHQERQLKLVRSLGRRLLQAHLEWIDEVEGETRGCVKRSLTPAPREQR